MKYSVKYHNSFEWLWASINITNYSDIEIENIVIASISGAYRYGSETENIRASVSLEYYIKNSDYREAIKAMKEARAKKNGDLWEGLSC